jgi:hypothetical protein
MWCHLFQGYCLLCLRERGAYEHLAEGALPADRLNMAPGMENALRCLAALCAAAGYLDDAARLIGYAEASFAVSHNLMWSRVRPA